MGDKKEKKKKRMLHYNTHPHIPEWGKKNVKGFILYSGETKKKVRWSAQTSMHRVIQWRSKVFPHFSIFLYCPGQKFFVSLYLIFVERCAM